MAFVTPNSRVDEPPDPFEGINLASLERSLLKPRNLFGAILTTLVFVLTLIAILPLFSVLIEVIIRGGSQLSLELFTEVTPTAGRRGGGIGNAIVGTLTMVGIATLISLPIGIFGAIFLAEVGPGSRLATFVRFSAKILTGFPSVLAGVFAYGSVVLWMGSPSALAGGVALSILMIPMILLTAEDAIRMVPAKMREAAIGMGTTQAQTVRYILLPTAFPGILTGVMLAVARAAGETAPLLFTAMFAYRYSTSILDENTASLAVTIYQFSGSAYSNQRQLAWAAALVLMLLVLITNVLAQALAPKQVRR